MKPKVGEIYVVFRSNHVIKIGDLVRIKYDGFLESYKSERKYSTHFTMDWFNCHFIKVKRTHKISRFYT